jgi:hypothetical protein
LDKNQDAPKNTTTRSKRYKIQAAVFAGMLLLALVGMGLTMSLEQRSWEFWVFLLAVYGGVSVIWAWNSAKRKGQPIWKMVRTQVFHWSSVLVVFAVLMLFERTEIINRESASNVALLILALACVLAGVHFDWTFLLLGIVLGIMAVSIGYFEQYVVWFVMLPVIIAAGWGFYQLRKRRASDGQ